MGWGALGGAGHWSWGWVREKCFSGFLRVASNGVIN